MSPTSSGVQSVTGVPEVGLSTHRNSNRSFPPAAEVVVTSTTPSPKTNGTTAFGTAKLERLYDSGDGPGKCTGPTPRSLLPEAAIDAFKAPSSQASASTAVGNGNPDGFVDSDAIPW